MGLLLSTIRRLVTDGRYVVGQHATDVKVIWSHVVSADIAKLVTVHFFDE